MLLLYFIRCRSSEDDVGDDVVVISRREGHGLRGFYCSCIERGGKYTTTIDIYAKLLVLFVLALRVL
jgi:hypothetical protein